MKRLKQFIALAVCYCLLIQPVPVFATGGSESHAGPGNVTTGNCGVNSMGVKISFSKTSIKKDSFTSTSLYQRGVEPYILDADKLADTSCKDIYAELNAGMNKDQKNQWQCNNSIGIIVCRGDKNGVRGAVASEGTILQGKQDKAVYGGVIEGHGAAALTKDDAIAAVKRVVSLCESESGGKFGKDLLWGQKGDLVCALDILAVGEVWTLRYRNTNLAQITINGGGNKPLDPKKITVPDPDPSNPDIPIPIVEVYDTTHSSRDDIDIVGTH